MSEHRLDQLYCTHCTFRTSAQHRREGASGDQVFEETARAGSIPREKSHDVYTRFGSNLMFHVPGDMPSEEMVKHTAHTLPLRRLVYLPSVGGYRLVGQVCFRQTDTRGRPGASFSHVLIQDLKEFPTAWSPLDCLHLWGSKRWVIEDRPDLVQDLPPYRRLQDLDPKYVSPINDDVMRSFLTAPVGTEFHDPGNIITKRWQDKSPQSRQELLVKLLQAVLNLDFERRESLLIAVEPSVAALLFYGILRLLPPVGLREKVSFSTYQSHRDRVMTTLAATCFHDDKATDLPNDMYASSARGAAFNTFKADRHTPLKKTGKYAEGMVNKFVMEGTEAVDSFMGICEQLGVGKADELEKLLAIDGMVTELLTPQSAEKIASLERDLPKEPGLRAFLRIKLSESIDLETEAPPLTNLLNPPSQALLILKLLNEPGSPEHARELEPVVDAVLARWPDSEIGVVLGDKDVPKQRKVELLGRYVEKYGDLPFDLFPLFFTRGSVCSRDKVLEDVFRRLPAQVLRRFVLKTFSAHPTEICFCELLRNLAPLLASREHKLAFQELLHHLGSRVTAEDKKQFMNAAFSDKALRESVKTLGFDETISAHLNQVLETLDEAPLQLDQQLGLLEELKQFIPDGKLRIAGWRTVSDQLKELQRLNAEPVSLVQRFTGKGLDYEKDRAALELANGAKSALSTPEYGHTAESAKVVTRLAIRVLGSDGLPDGFNARCENYFEKGVWARRAVRKPDWRKFLTKRNLTIGGGLLAFIVVAVLLANILPMILPRQVVTTDLPGQKKATVKKQSKVNATGNEVESTTSVDKDTVDEQVNSNKKTENRTKVQPVEETNTTETATKKDQKVTNKSVARQAAADNPNEKKTTETKSVQKMPVEQQTVVKTPENPVVTGALVKWKPFFELPPIAQTTEEATSKPPLQSWSNASNQQFPLKGITFNLIGTDELNDYLATSRSKILQGTRLYPISEVLNEMENTQSIRVYKLLSSDYDDANGTRKTTGKLQEIHQLCVFEIRNNGIVFEWKNESIASLKELQEMVRMCCLHVNDNGKSYDINLINPEMLLSEEVRNGIAKSSVKAPSAQFVDGPPSYRVKNRVALQFQPKLPGVTAVPWMVTRGRIAYVGESNERQDRQFNLTGKLPQTAAKNGPKEIDLRSKELDKAWVESNFPCDSVKFIQEWRVEPPDQNYLDIVVVPDWSEVTLTERSSNLIRIKDRLTKTINTLQSKLGSAGLGPKAAVSADVKHLPLNELKQIEAFELELDALMRTKEGIGDGSKRMHLVNFIDVEIKSDTALEELDLDKLKEYLDYVKKSESQIDKEVVRISEQITRKVQNGKDELDEFARTQVKKYKKIEVYEMSRFLDGRWVPVVYVDKATVEAEK